MRVPEQTAGMRQYNQEELGTALCAAPLSGYRNVVKSNESGIVWYGRVLSLQQEGSG